MKQYYAFNWSNGVGALDSKTGLPIGSLGIFDSSRARDKFVALNVNATVVEASVAAKLLARYISLTSTDWTPEETY